MAEAVMRHLLTEAGRSDAFVIDSAGTGSWHVGQPPDPRARAAGARHGYLLTGQARVVNDHDFLGFDLIVAVDDDNLMRLKDLAPPGATAEIRKLDDADVPDPYYGGDSGFADVLDQVERACRNLLAELTGQQA